MKLKNFLKNNWNYIIVFFIPWILVLLHSIVRGSWISRDGSMLHGDIGVQLYPLFVELWNKVHSGESLFFSWNGGNGFDFYLNFVYYLISPFNLIILLFPKEWIEHTMQFVMILKWSLMGVTMTCYFMHTKHNHLKENKKFVSMVLGLTFVLSDCLLVFFGYFNWSDVIIYFPILLLLLERMIENGTWKLYYILLTVCMVCNFYMSYQVCIFLVIWFFVNMNQDVSNKIRRFLCFAGSSALAALTAMITILPAVLCVSSRYSTDITKEREQNFVKTIMNSIFELGSKSFMMSDGVLDFYTFKPNLYFTVGCLTFVILFLFSTVKLKEKIKFSLLGLFLTLSTVFGFLSYFWHGFSFPHGVFHRFLYLFVFVMLFITLQTLQNLNNIKLWHIIITAFLQGLFYASMFLNLDDYGEFYGYLVTFLFFAIYIITLVLFIRKSITKKQMILVYFMMVIVELCINGFYCLKEYNIVTWENSYENKDLIPLLDDLELEAGERVDLLQCVQNMAMSEGLQSTNVFVSYCNGNMVRFYERMGFDYSSDAAYRAYGSSPLTNVLFNIRYCAGNQEIGFSDVTLVEENGDMGLYRVNNLVGLGYMVDNAVEAWDISEDLNFELQNSFIQYATGEDAIFEIVKPEATFTDGFLMYNYDESYYNEGYFYYNYISMNYTDLEMTEFLFTAEEDMDLYIDIFSDKDMKNIIFLSQDKICDDIDKRCQGIYHVGPVKKGEQIAIYSQHSLDIGEEANLWFRFAKFNEDNYQKAYESMSKNVYKIDEMSSVYVSGKIHADNDGIMMTAIPDMNGFKVYVDGKATEYKSIGDTFIGVPLKAGDHKVEFRYRTPYFIEGMIGSIVGLFIFIALCVVSGMKKRKGEMIAHTNGEE